MLKRTCSVVKDLSDAVKAAEGVVDARIMHMIIDHMGDLDDALKSALTEDDVLTLVQMGADASTPAGTAAVVEAARNERSEVIRALLQHGAAATDAALLAAVTKRHLPSVKVLVDHKAKCDTYTVFIAANNGDLEILNCIIGEAPDDARSVALSAAISGDHVHVVYDMLSKHAPNVADLMSMDMSEEMIEVVEKHVEDVTPAMILRAVLEDVSLDVFHMLIRRADFVLAEELRPALHAAITMGKTEFVKTLVNNEVPVA